MVKDLTKKQMNTLMKHKKHHSKKHMDFMTKEMKKGKSFTIAHRMAMKKIGKGVRQLLNLNLHYGKELLLE